MIIVKLYADVPVLFMMLSLRFLKDVLIFIYIQ